MPIERLVVSQKRHLVSIKSSGQRLTIEKPSIKVIALGKVGPPGSGILTVRTITADTTVADSDGVIFADISAAGAVLTLPPIAERTTELRIGVLNNYQGTQLLSVVTNDVLETIDGEATVEMYGGDKITLIPRTTTDWGTI